MSEQHDTFDTRLRERFQQDAIGLDPQLRQRAAGAARARRRGERRRRVARTTFALGAVLGVLAAGLTAWQVHNRRDATVVVDPPPSTTPPSTTTPDVGPVPVVTVPTEPTTTVPPAPPPTVAPDPTGAGALPLDWREVPAQVATWGKLVVAEDGTTYSLFDANASTAVPGPGPGAKSAPRTMTVGRSRDGESWDTVATMPWASDIAVAGNTLYLAGNSPTVSNGPLRLRLAESSDGGEGWTEADVEVSGFTLDFSADLTIPFELGPSSNPAAGASTTDTYGRTWGALFSLSIDPTLVAGTSGVVVAVNQYVLSSEAAAQCMGAVTSDATYWYEYQDGYTVQVIPDHASQGYGASFVRPGTQAPSALVRCSVPRAALGPRNDKGSATTALLRRSSVGVWNRLSANLPATGSGWQVFPLNDGFVAQSISTDRVVSQRRSSDAASWSEFASPAGWPALFQGSSSRYGQRVIGADAANHQVATSMDGGSSWQRVDLATLPVPDGTVAQRFQMGETSAGPWGFVIRYYPADGNRFWRMVATSRDGRTWTAIDEAAIGAMNGNLGARLGIGGGFLTMTTNENTIDGRFVSKTFIGTPSG